MTTCSQCGTDHMAEDAMYRSHHRERSDYMGGPTQQGQFRLRAWAWFNRCHVLDWGEDGDCDFVVPRYGYYDPNFSLPTNARPRFVSSLALASAVTPLPDSCRPPAADPAARDPSRE